MLCPFLPVLLFSRFCDPPEPDPGILDGGLRQVTCSSLTCPSGRGSLAYTFDPMTIGCESGVSSLVPGPNVLAASPVRTALGNVSYVADKNRYLAEQLAVCSILLDIVPAHVLAVSAAGSTPFVDSSVAATRFPANVSFATDKPRLPDQLAVCSVVDHDPPASHWVPAMLTSAPFGGSVEGASRHVNSSTLANEPRLADLLADCPIRADAMPVDAVKVEMFGKTAAATYVCTSWPATTTPFVFLGNELTTSMTGHDIKYVNATATAPFSAPSSTSPPIEAGLALPLDSLVLSERFMISVAAFIRGVVFYAKRAVQVTVSLGSSEMTFANSGTINSFTNINANLSFVNASDIVASASSCPNPQALLWLELVQGPFASFEYAGRNATAAAKIRMKAVHKRADFPPCGLHADYPGSERSSHRQGPDGCHQRVRRLPPTDALVTSLDLYVSKDQPVTYGSFIRDFIRRLELPGGVQPKAFLSAHFNGLICITSNVLSDIGSIFLHFYGNELFSVALSAILNKLYTDLFQLSDHEAFVWLRILITIAHAVATGNLATIYINHLAAFSNRRTRRKPRYSPFTSPYEHDEPSSKNELDEIMTNEVLLIHYHLKKSISYRSDTPDAAPIVTTGETQSESAPSTDVKTDSECDVASASPSLEDMGEVKASNVDAGCQDRTVSDTSFESDVTKIDMDPSPADSPLAGTPTDSDTPVARSTQITPAALEEIENPTSTPEPGLSLATEIMKDGVIAPAASSPPPSDHFANPANANSEESAGVTSTAAIVIDDEAKAVVNAAQQDGVDKSIENADIIPSIAVEEIASIAVKIDKASVSTAPAPPHEIDAAVGSTVLGQGPSATQPTADVPVSTVAGRTVGVDLTTKPSESGSGIYASIYARPRNDTNSETKPSTEPALAQKIDVAKKLKPSGARSSKKKSAAREAVDAPLQRSSKAAAPAPLPTPAVESAGRSSSSSIYATKSGRAAESTISSNTALEALTAPLQRSSKAAAPAPLPTPAVESAGCSSSSSMYATKSGRDVESTFSSKTAHDSPSQASDKFSGLIEAMHSPKTGPGANSAAATLAHARPSSSPPSITGPEAPVSAPPASTADIRRPLRGLRRNRALDSALSQTTSQPAAPKGTVQRSAVYSDLSVAFAPPPPDVTKWFANAGMPVHDV